MGMRISSILQQTTHRPWKMPENKWQFYQEWNRAVFLHWPVSPEVLKPFIPGNLELDLFDGVAWVSLVAFTMEKIRPRLLPSFSPISNFDEINIRTYVKLNQKAGVYFLSIEGGKKASCQIAKSLSELPYRYSKIKRTPDFYTSENEVFKDRLLINYQVGNLQTRKNEIDLWLTERYALFQDTPRAINAFEIHHCPWGLLNIQIHTLEVHYPRFSNLINDQPVFAHYSDGVQVVAWGKEVIG